MNLTSTEGKILLLEEPILLSLTGCIDANDEKDNIGGIEALLERKLAFALGLSRPDLISVIEVDFDVDVVTFVVYPASTEDKGGEDRWGCFNCIVDSGSISGDDFAKKLNDLIRTGDAAIKGWLTTEARCKVVDVDAEDENVVYIEEMEAMELWRKDTDRTSHLASFPSPDGEMIQPMHSYDYDAASSAAAAGDGTSAEAPKTGFGSPTQLQLRRDPLLLEFDNVHRVDASRLEEVSWTEPIIATGCVAAALLEQGRQRIACATLRRGQYADAEVRTGNRETLAVNGFVNSMPMALGEALYVENNDGGGGECSRIVFSPITELPEGLRLDLAAFVEAFPIDPEALTLCEGKDQEEPLTGKNKKFTLCLGNEGFGIGFHRHNAAMFLLLAGRKKWYMGSREAVEDDHPEPTHPGFYGQKSSHKCIQVPGEVLYVPDQWYHEIFNLEYTAGIQALPE